MHEYRMIIKIYLKNLSFANDEIEQFFKFIFSFIFIILFLVVNLQDIRFIIFKYLYSWIIATIFSSLGLKFFKKW